MSSSSPSASSLQGQDPSPPFPDGADEESVESKHLREQLEQLKNEKAVLEAQHTSLLGKLTTMRNTLGDKLRQDADELDKREQQIGQLQAQNEQLFAATEALKSELFSSNEENESLQQEINQIRSKTLESQRLMEAETYEREQSLRENREQIEKLWNELEDQKRELMSETVKRERAEGELADVLTALSAAIKDIENLKADRDLQAESASNLQSVLEAFQSAKEEEIQSVVSDTQTRLSEVEKQLKVYKAQATSAEARLAIAESDSRLCESLKQELKEKTLLIGKVRHEAVILNEHLTEALRRLRRDSSEYSVDRRLVTNVLLSFILTPREDTKRFEMLQLLGSILSWDDDQRELVGLKKMGSSGSKAARNLASSYIQPNGSRSGPLRNQAHSEDTLGDNDTISDQWVSFLLREANSANFDPMISKQLSSLSIHPPKGPNKSQETLTPADGTHVAPPSPGSSLSTLSTVTRPTSDSP